MKKVYVTTLGCRLNQFDSDAVEAQLQKRGHQIVSRLEEADVHLVNTCTITHRADSDVRKITKRSHRSQPTTPIALMGCYAQGAAQEAAELPNVRLIVGNQNKSELAEALEDLDLKQAPSLRVLPFTKKPKFEFELHASSAPRRTRAYLKIQDGCNYRCSFCIVPQVRGNSRSLEPAAVVSQLKTLVAAGHPEVVVTGVHLGTYGRDLSPKRSFSSLIAELLEHCGETKLRLGSLDPHEVDSALITLLKEHPNLCPYLHLPVQSLDDDILKRMRRQHDANDFTSLCTRLFKEIPKISIGTDVIVGHPGEDDLAFEATRRGLEGLPLAYHHVFSYSDRQGTAATTMYPKVNPQVIKVRNGILRKLSDEQGTEYTQANVGTQLSAVKLSQKNDEFEHTLLSDTFIKLKIRSGRVFGKRHTVEVLSVLGPMLAEARFIELPSP